jgi:hypothetical protein
MPNMYLNLDPNAAPFNAVDMETEKVVLAQLLFPAIAVQVKRVTGVFGPNDLDLEPVYYGTRITGPDAPLFPLNLTIFGSDTDAWQGDYDLDGAVMPKPQAAQQLIAEAIAETLQGTAYGDIDFDVTIRLTRGSWGTSDEARARLAAKQATG